MERDAADVGALSFVRVVRVWRRERDSNLPMVGVGSPEVSARGGMGGTRRHSIIEATPDFCIETARCLNHNILWYAARDRGISRGFSLEEL